MKLQKLLTISALTLAVATNVFAKDGKIKVGVQASPQLKIAEVAAKIAKEKYGVEVELVPFTDYVTPNVALETKTLDANAFQHKPFLDAQAKARGWKDLVVLANTLVYPMAAYSSKIKDIKALKDGATVVIPNDPTNGGRALLLLQRYGLIKLKNPQSLTQSILDIVENPKKLKIKDAEANIVAKTLGSSDLVVINSPYAVQAGLYPNRDGILIEGKDSPYVNIIVAREDNKNDPDIQKFIKAYQTEEVYQTGLKEFKNAVIKGW